MLPDTVPAVSIFTDTSGPQTLKAIAALDDPGRSDRIAVRDPSLDDSHSARHERWLQVAPLLANHGVRPGPSHTAGTDGTLTPCVDAFFDPHDLDGCDRDLSVDPLVVLSYEIPSLDHLVRFPSELPWVALSPQTAGMACHHPLLVALPVELHENGRELARILATFADRPDVGHDCVGCGGLQLGELSDYATLLRGLGLHSEQVWYQLEEARSPLDATADNLAALGSLPNGADLGTIVGIGEDIGTRQRWSITVLGENCD
jgi:hypothetical protein